MLVAIQGEEGSNSSVAARLLLGDSISLRCCSTFFEALSALDGEAPVAVLPVENTTAGLVQEVWDALMGLEPGSPQLSALAEVRVEIRFVAAALGTAEQVRRILAHPVAAAQCRRFLNARGWEVAPCHDTAGAARLVRERGDVTTAALCPPSAAERYQLAVLHDSCGDQARTLTRFFQVVRGAPRQSPHDNRCAVALTLLDQPGALARALTVLGSCGVNLCALHSRAVPGAPGSYRFIAELEAGALDPSTAAALSALNAQGAQVRVLGSWRG